jgi:uncharacterized protein
MTPITPISRRACLPWLLSLPIVLGACAGPALPTPQWWRLPAEAAPPAAPAAVPTREVWQLVGAVALPGHLDRDALLVPVAGSAARLQPREAARWAEPLRDALPRLLRADLASALGAPLWTAPLPAGLQPTRLLRLELVAFDLQPGLRGLQVQARYTLASAGLAGTGLAPRAGEIAFVQAVTADETEALVLAHRAAIATLAQRLAAL